MDTVNGVPGVVPVVVVGEGERVIFPEIAAALLIRDDRILLIDQPRRHDGGVSIELPGGRIEPGENPARAALRELLEETGLVGHDARPLLTFDMDRSWCRYRTHLVVIGWAEPSGRPGERVPQSPRLDDAARLVHSGTITHAVTAAAVLLAASTATRPGPAARPDGDSPASRVR